MEDFKRLKVTAKIQRRHNYFEENKPCTQCGIHKDRAIAILAKLTTENALLKLGFKQVSAECHLNAGLLIAYGLFDARSCKEYYASSPDDMRSVTMSAEALIPKMLMDVFYLSNLEFNFYEFEYAWEGKEDPKQEIPGQMSFDDIRDTSELYQTYGLPAWLTNPLINRLDIGYSDRTEQMDPRYKLDSLNQVLPTPPIQFKREEHPPWTIFFRGKPVSEVESISYHDLDETGITWAELEEVKVYEGMPIVDMVQKIQELRRKKFEAEHPTKTLRNNHSTVVMEKDAPEEVV